MRTANMEPDARLRVNPPEQTAGADTGAMDSRYLKLAKDLLVMPAAAV